MKQGIQLINAFINMEEQQKDKLFNNDPSSKEMAELVFKAARYNTGKPRWSLMHWESIEPMIRVLEFGAKKYSVDNWKKGLEEKALIDCMARHLAAMSDGKKIDYDENCADCKNNTCLSHSGLPHSAHIQCNLMFYNYFYVLGNKPLTDENR